MAADDAYATPAGTAERVRPAAGRREPAGVPDSREPSYGTGTAEPAVPNPPSGRRAGGTAVAERVRRRPDFPRGTRRRADGRRFPPKRVATGTPRKTAADSGRNSGERRDGR